jgi:hypothetical protein
MSGSGIYSLRCDVKNVLMKCVVVVVVIGALCCAGCASNGERASANAGQQKGHERETADLMQQGG